MSVVPLVKAFFSPAWEHQVQNNSVPLVASLTSSHGYFVFHSLCTFLLVVWHRTVDLLEVELGASVIFVLVTGGSASAVDSIVEEEAEGTSTDGAGFNAAGLGQKKRC